MIDRSFRRLASLALASLMLGPTAWALELPDQSTQGALVIGRVEPASTVQVDGRSVQVDEEGRFVFGIGRDRREPVQVRARSAEGVERDASVAIAARDYRIERVDGLPPQTVTPDPAIAARIAEEQARVARARERDDARSDFAAGFRRPIDGGRISGVYGSQRILNGEPRAPHMGLDIAVPTGTPVLAPAPGVVSFADPGLYLTGGTLLIDHGHGISTSYLHLSRIDVSLGQRVEAGDRIGAVGATGRASGPHLHWGLNWFGERLDPALLLE